VADDAARAIVVEYRPSQGGRRRARVTVREGQGAPRARELVQPGPGCDALADAVALTVALIVDPDAARRTPPPPPAASPVCTALAPAPCPACAACPPPVVVPFPSAPPTAPAPRSPARRPWAALTAGLSFGLSPSTPAPSFGLAVNLPLRGPWSLDLGASYTPSAASDDGAASVARTVARVGACLDTAPTLFQFGACAGATAGALHLTALALEPVNPGDRAWLGVSSEVHGRVLPSERWLVAVFARLEVPLLTAAPRVERAPEPSFSPWPVALELGLAIGVRAQ
jgi:hypothetical protein